MTLNRRVSAWIGEHELLAGIALVLFLGTGSSIALSTIELSGSERPADWLGFLLIWVIAVCAFWYRRKPLFALPVATALLAIYWILDYPGSSEPAVWLLFYCVPRYGGEDRVVVWRVVAASTGVLTTVAIIGVLSSIEDLPAYAVVAIFVVHATFSAIGEAVYQRRLHIAQLEQRAADLEADLENKAALAAAEERTRIAREMHDIIAHGMSTVVVQAQAAQSVVASNPEQAREVLKTIENIGRSSVDEMRRMLGVLRSEESELELEPQPGFHQLDELFAQVKVEGVELDVMVTGDLQSLPAGLDLTGYRIVQEALTNVLRHAGRPVQVTVMIDCGDEELAISITDNGLGAAATSRESALGHGLRGMRERVELYDGTVRAEPTSGGGFGVNATLPIPAKVIA